MKKLFVVMIMTLLVLGLFAACSSNDEATTNEATTSEPVTITMLVDATTNTAGIEAVATAAEKKLGIHLEMEVAPSGSELDNLVKTRLNTGTMDDICLYNSGSLFMALNPSKYFVDLSDQDFVSRYDGAYKDTVSVGNAVYGVPATCSQVDGWLYNKKVYEKLGLKVPQTWDELMRNCDVIKKAGITAIIGSYADSWTAQPIFLGDAYSVLYGDPTFADDFTANKASYAETPSALRAFEKLSESAPYVNEDCMSTNYDAAIEMLATGQGAHYVMLTQALTNINSLYPEAIDDIGIFAQPGDTPEETGMTVYMPNSFYVSKTSKQIDAAIRWLGFFVSAEGMDLFNAAVLPEGPAVISGVHMPEKSYAAIDEMQVYFDDGKTSPALEFLSPIKGSACPEICVDCAVGNKTALESAIEYDKDCAKQAQQLGLENW